MFGKEAVKVWVWRALQPGNARFLYSAHTGSYGHRLDGLAGLALPEAESRMAGMVRKPKCPQKTAAGIQRPLRWEKPVPCTGASFLQ